MLQTFHLLQLSINRQCSRSVLSNHTGKDNALFTDLENKLLFQIEI